VDRNAEESQVIQMRQLESARELLERTLREQNA
jgi:ribosomal protein L16/L10AE